LDYGDLHHLPDRIQRRSRLGQNPAFTYLALALTGLITTAVLALALWVSSPD
jgi:hypothetical protein